MHTDAAPQLETGTVHKKLKTNSHVQETVTGFGRIHGIDGINALENRGCVII
jgi:hypothetical protein